MRCQRVAETIITGKEAGIKIKMDTTLFIVLIIHDLTKTWYENISLLQRRFSANHFLQKQKSIITILSNWLSAKTKHIIYCFINA